MILVPSVDDWWQLTREFPQFDKVSNSVLKDFGYMSLLREIKQERPIRILEFGHGFNDTVFQLSENDGDIEIWGIDDFQGLHYFPNKKEWEARYQDKLVARFPKTRFVRGLLGDRESKSMELPEDYFDMVCSVSVLEEVSIDVVKSIVSHSYRLLRPNGILMGTHDICLRNLHRIKVFIDASCECGFQCKGGVPALDGTGLLIENPTSVMVQYQRNDGEHRRYSGHWTTLLTRMVKPLAEKIGAE